MDEFKPENNQEINQENNQEHQETEVYSGGISEMETVSYAEETLELSFMQRLIGIILSPLEAFKDIERSPKVLFPILLVAFSQVAFLGARFPLYKQYLLENMKMMMKKGPVQLSTEQMITAVNTQATMGLVATPIVSVIFLLIGTAVIMWIFRIFGGKGTYKQYLAMNGYTNVIGAVYLIIALVLSFFTANLYIDVPYDSIATFMGPDMRGTWLFGIAKGIRVFSLWQYGVFATGLICISKVDKRIVYGLVVLGFIAMVLFGGYGEIQLAKYL